MPVTKSDPTDACGQALEFDARPRHVEPIVQMLIVRHQFFDLGIGTKNVFRVARQRCPAERPNAAAEQWADIGGYEARKVERVVNPHFVCHLAYIVPVIECRHAAAPEVEHRTHVDGHRLLRCARDPARICRTPRLPLGERPTRW
jgi:hypothetical protein